MLYTVENKPKKLEIVLLDSAISFAYSYLNLDIDLSIEFQTLKKEQYGFCDYEEDEVIIIISKRLSVKDIIRTLFHELVHVRQYESKRLKHNGIWEGRIYDCEYDKLPWEVEAFELEERMMKFFYG